MKKIIFFLPALVGGGAERTIVNVANRIDRRRYKVYLMVIDMPSEGKYKDEYSQFLYKDVHIINLRIKIEKKNYPYILFSMIRRINEIKPDIVMSTMLRSNELLALASIFYSRSIKTVLRESSNHSPSKYSWLEKIFIRFMYGKIAARTIALSKGVKKNMVMNFGVSEKNVEVIYNPIDIENIESQIKKRNYVLEFPGVKIINVGRLTKAKDQETLIKAIHLVKNQIDCKLYIMGKGELEDDLKKLTHTFDLDGCVEFLGFQSNPYAILAQGDLFVLSSAWEGFGHVIVEAMVAGVPVLSTNCNYGPDEIITNEYNGVLSPVGNARELADNILKIVDDKDKMNMLKQHGRERAEDFSIDKIVREYENLFDKI